MLEVLFGLRIRTNVSVRSFSSKVVNAMDFRGQVGFFIISNNLYNSFIMNSIRMLIEIEFLDAIRNCIEFIFVGFEFAYNEQILQIYQSVAYNSQLLNIQKLTQNRVVGFSKEFLCLFFRRLQNGRQDEENNISIVLQGVRQQFILFFILS